MIPKTNVLPAGSSFRVRARSGPDSGTLKTAFLIFLLLALVPMAASFFNDAFLVRIFARIMILALAAMSLDLIMGYGGMVSFGHAAFLGIGAYAVGVMSLYADGGAPLPAYLGFLASTDAWVVWPLAILFSALGAAVIGYVALRTSGLYFLMITLAFAQMLHYFLTALDVYGGQDGIQMSGPSMIPLGDLNDVLTLYYLIWFILAAVFYLLYRLVRSRFGLTIQGIRENKRRMACLGFKTFSYRLTCFVISGAIAGVAGILLANNEQYVSPAIIHWSVSGELMMMCILGGTGTLIGPILGAIIYSMAEYWLSNYSVHWQLVFGPLLVFAVLFLRRGVLGLVSRKAGGE
ncbi:Branched-chain amino acid transport system permease protein OS=Castellaniella defragrans OX=75697 GN=HNR28_003467 PE=4 SV=1 [Castellaniella defragrans]